jgi:hypothetical protein
MEGMVGREREYEAVFDLLLTRGALPSGKAGRPSVGRACAEPVHWVDGSACRRAPGGCL